MIDMVDFFCSIIVLWRCWLSLLFAIPVMLTVQLVVHFGCKFALFPLYISRFFENGHDNEFQTGNNIFWMIPLPGSIVLYFGLYFLIFFLITKIFKIESSIHQKSQYNFFHLSLFAFIFVIAFIIIADSGFARNAFFTMFKDNNKEDYVIDCKNATIRFQSHIANVKSPLCHFCYQLKTDEERDNCKYVGLDSFEPLKYMP